MEVKKKILQYGLYLFAFLLPFQTQLILQQGRMADGDWQYGTIGLYAVDIVLIAVLLVFGWYYFRDQIPPPGKKIKVPLFWWLLAGMDLFAFISIFLAPDHGLAVYRYAVFLLAIGVVLLVIRAPIWKVKFVYFFVLGMFFHALLGAGQFLYQYAPGCKYLGLAEHNPKTLGVSVVEIIGMDGVARRWLRAYGGLDHPNILGGSLAVSVLLLIGLWAAKRFYYKKDYFHWNKIAQTQVKKQEKKQAGNYVLFLVLVMGMFFSFSRGAWLAFVAGAAVLLLGYWWTKRKSQAGRVGKILGLGLVLVIVLSFSYSSIVATRLSGDTRLEMKSDRQRLQSIEESWTIIRENPFGVGIGNYTLALQKENPDRKVWAYQPVHNTFLLIAAEIGVVGVLFFVAVLGYLFWQSFRQKNILNLAILTSLVIMLMLDHWWWSLHFGVLFLGLILGLTFKNLNNGQSIVSNQQ